MPIPASRDADIDRLVAYIRENDRSLNPLCPLCLRNGRLHPFNYPDAIGRHLKDRRLREPPMPNALPQHTEQELDVVLADLGLSREESPPHEAPPAPAPETAPRKRGRPRKTQ